MSAASEFWAWFTSIAGELRAEGFPPDEAWLDRIVAQLVAYREGLGVDLGEEPDGTFELIVTAQGDPALFEAVDELVACAPELAGWRCVALKPAMGFDIASFVVAGIELDPKTCWFMPLTSPQDPDAFGLRIACPGYVDEVGDALADALSTILQWGLGEREAAETIRYLELAPVPEAPEAAGFIELVELPDYLAWWRRRRSS